MKYLKIIFIFIFFSLSSIAQDKCLKNILESTISESDKMNINKESKSINKLRRALTKKGRELRQYDFLIHRIPKRFREYFKSDGSFSYQTSKPVVLSTENGSEELKAVRINWRDKKTDGISGRTLYNMLSVLDKMPNLDLIIYVSKDSVDLVNSLLVNVSDNIKNRIKIIETHSAIKPTYWAQDGSKPISSTDTQIYLPKRNSDDDFVLSSNVSSVNSKFEFDGGNIVVGSKHVFIGFTDINEQAYLMKTSFKEAQDALSKEFSKPVIAVDNVDYHIDLNMAVINNPKTRKDEILLASPELAIQLLLKSPLMTKLENMDLKSLTDGEVELLSFIDHIKSRPRVLEKLKLRNEQLKKVKKDLEKSGYKVIDLPDFSLVDEYNMVFNDYKLKSTDENSPSMFNYTNMILSTKHALIPSTGVGVWDEYVSNFLRNYEKEVIPMDVTQKSVCQKGGIRCLSETHRTKWSPSTRSKSIKNTLWDVLKDID